MLKTIEVNFILYILANEGSTNSTVTGMFLCLLGGHVFESPLRQGIFLHNLHGF